MTKFNEYLIGMRAEKKAANTIARYAEAISSFFAFVNKDAERVEKYDILAWMESMSDASSATINIKLNALNSYFKFLCECETIKKNPMENVKRPSIHSKPKEFMSADMVSALINAATNARDKALISCYATTGLRFNELTSITLKQYEQMRKDGTNKIAMTGKGGKEFFVFFSDANIAAIEQYLPKRKDGCEYLFTSTWGGKINNANFDKTLKVIGRKAGLPFEISAHSLRAACASIMSENGVPVAVIRDVLHHSSISTTSRYIKTNEKAVNAAVSAMTF